MCSGNGVVCVVQYVSCVIVRYKRVVSHRVVCIVCCIIVSCAVGSVKLCHGVVCVVQYVYCVILRWCDVVVSPRVVCIVRLCRV